MNNELFYEDARTRWNTLDNERSVIKYRCEKYAAFTIPKICLLEGYNQSSYELQHDWQALGAQAVNNLVNKLMLALFAPSRPFFRLDVDQKIIEYFVGMGATPQQISESLSVAEKESIKQLDKRSLRPKLIEVLKHLVITGNVLLVLDKKNPRVIGFKNYVCKRTVEGDVIEILVKDQITVQQLDREIRSLPEFVNKQMTDKVDYLKWVKLDENDEYRMSQWVDGIRLNDKFDGKWTKDTLPYRCITWDLADNNDYGTSYVEDYIGDFEALSALSKAKIEGAILASEYRWLVNPSGMTKPDDLYSSQNGSAIPGMQGDISIISADTQSQLQVIQSISDEYIQRISRGFLLTSAITRNAERVTAEEIRMQANELETSLGGAYSRIAVDLQVPFSKFLLNLIDFKFKGKSIEPIIVTGLDALSRTADADNIKLWIADMAQIVSLPPMFKQGSIASALASSYGINSSDYMVSEQEQEQMRQQAAAAQQQQQLQQQGQPDQAQQDQAMPQQDTGQAMPEQQAKQ